MEEQAEGAGAGAARDGFVSRAAGIRVRESDLGGMTPIGGGAATEVHRLDSFTVPGHHGGLAFVRLRDRGADRTHSAVLSRLVAARWQLDADRRATLDGLAAWPLAVVEADDGEVVGCVLSLAPHPFYYVPTEGEGFGKTPQQLKWLVTAPKRARRAGASAVDERDLVARSTVLARVCLLLDLLHREGIVFGDLSERSVLYGTGEVPAAFVVGCEGTGFEGEGVEQRNSAGWAAPETPTLDGAADAATLTTPSVQSVATDRYKLGLLVLRVLAPAGDGLERSRDADRARGVLDETGLRLLRAALGDDAAARPAAAEWYGYLRGVILASLSAPTIERVEVSPALVAEGDEVRLEVEASGARRLVIEMPGRADITREVGSRVVLERFTARQSGRIGVRAENDHGSAEAVSQPVRVLPVPTPARIAVATPAVPERLGVLADLAPLEAAMGISLAPVNGGAAGEAGADGASPFDRVRALREQLEAEALPLQELQRIGVEAERASRDHGRLFPSFERFLDEVTGSDRRR